MNSTDKKIAELQKSRKKLCELYGVNPKKVSKVLSKITPLLQKVMTKGEVLNTFQETFTDVKRGMEYWHEIHKVINTEKFTSMQKSLLRLFSYLQISEGLLAPYIDLIIFILIENGHDLYDPQRAKFVKSYKDLDKVSLFIKLKFIEEHGLKFVADAFDRELRNCIAHFLYTVKDDGTIINKTTGRKIEDLEKKMDYIGALNATITSILNEILLRRNTPSIPDQ